MTQLRVLLSLATTDNDYQREQANAAQAVASQAGIDLRVIYAGGDAITQTKQLLAVTQATDDRPDVIVVHPCGTSMPQVAKAAVQQQIGWIVVNRVADYVAELRAQSKVPVAGIALDNVEVGRLQGLQFAALLPSGGTVLYLEGPSNEVSKNRRAGTLETLPSNIELQPARGRWTSESGAQALAIRLGLRGTRVPDLIGSQNDDMAMGARQAVEALPPGPQRDQWLSIPYTGVDGVPATGQAWVQQHLLAATIVVPPLAGVAVELLAKAVLSGHPMPERTTIRPTSYPPIAELRPATTIPR
ncbi:MAG TPA: substrate-binding domain-containing protein [Gemmatimonadaceae bacterium]|nr:substrate-binding domain-containing protein [Gemmatimonadaceae bacterium]